MHVASTPLGQGALARTTAVTRCALVAQLHHHIVLECLCVYFKTPKILDLLILKIGFTHQPSK